MVSESTILEASRNTVLKYRTLSYEENLCLAFSRDNPKNKNQNLYFVILCAVLAERKCFLLDIKE